jgi:hypothetical protein
MPRAKKASLVNMFFTKTFVLLAVALATTATPLKREAGVHCFWSLNPAAEPTDVSTDLNFGEYSSS